MENDNSGHALIIKKLYYERMFSYGSKRIERKAVL